MVFTLLKSWYAMWLTYCYTSRHFFWVIFSTDANHNDFLFSMNCRIRLQNTRLPNAIILLLTISSIRSNSCQMNNNILYKSIHYFKSHPTCWKGGSHNYMHSCMLLSDPLNSDISEFKNQRLWAQKTFNYAEVITNCKVISSLSIKHHNSRDIFEVLSVRLNCVPIFLCSYTHLQQFISVVCFVIENNVM